MPYLPPSLCPACRAPWERTELTGEAQRGGGYRVLCHECGHEWDDPYASHGDRATARRQAAMSAPRCEWCGVSPDQAHVDGCPGAPI